MHEETSRVRLRVAALQARSPALYDALANQGRAEGGVLVVDRAIYYALRAEHLPVKVATKNDWPAWALVVALFADASDRGVGDTVRRELGEAERFKRHHEAVFGVWAKPCNCSGKTAQWNRLYPYTETPTPDPI